MARTPVVPGEPAVQAEASQPELPAQTNALAVMQAQIDAQAAVINQLLKRGSGPEAPPVEYPTQEEAQAMARESGRFVLSRDGYIGPPVIKPSPVVAVSR